MQTTTEARRYIDNAKEILREKARKEDGFYQDAKYVRNAGHTACIGVLMALDGLFGKRAETIIDWVETKTAA